MSAPVASAAAAREQHSGWSVFVRWLRGLGYESSAEGGGTRDLRVDLLRGFCVFAMVVDHFGGDSWLYALTGGNRFYVSAAEGFIFVSGMVMGQAYHRRVMRDGLVDAMVEALLRARTLYIATVTLTIIFSMLYLYTDISLWTGRDYGLGVETLDEVIVGTLTLHYTYHGTDILAMYTLLILAAPLALLLLAIGQWRWVLLPSWLWWLAFQGYPEQASLPWYIRHGENFPLGAWQVLFVTGLVMGYHRQRIAAWLKRWTPLRILLAAFAVALTMALVSLFTNIEAGTVPPGAPFGFFDVQPNVLEETFYKVSLRPWRLIAFAALAIAAFTTATYLWKPLHRGLGWLLLPLGQHALYAYIVHFFLILVIYNLAPFLTADFSGVASVDTALQVGLVAALWALIRGRFLFGVIPN